MVRAKLFPIVAAAAFSAACVSFAVAQSDSLPAAGRAVPSVSPIRAVTEVPGLTPFRPFSVDLSAPEQVYAIELRSPAQMTDGDRKAVADAEAAISERSGFAGIEFAQGKWNYRQIVCPAFPNHLFLRFTRNNGTGDVSLLTASIPRNGQGRVRIVPIQRRGYSLFSPAPINPITITAFNHIRDEEAAPEQPSWFGMGLCYAALGGASPWALRPSPSEAAGALPDPSLVQLETGVKGGAVVRFTDRAVQPRPMDWALVFNAQGRLLKASHTAASTQSPRVVQQTSSTKAERAVPATIESTANLPVQAAPARKSLLGIWPTH
jgi:hypothetical protein